LLKKILNTNPRKRLSIEDIKSHPWFNMIKPSLSEGYSFTNSEFLIEEGK